MSDRAIVQNAAMDSTRWDRFTHRPGDILVCTPPKCGTTWTQAIVASLLWPAGDVPGPVMDLAPWWDANFYPVEELVARLAAQTFRRSVKTHLPAEAIPWWETASYIAVFRDGRDAFMSYVNHIASFRDDVRERLNAAAVEKGLQTMPAYDGDLQELYAQWIDLPLPLVMLRGWWERRHRRNVLLVHFNDLRADLDGEMRRIAAFLGVPIDPRQWPDQVARCTFEAMKRRADEIGRFAFFVGGGENFLHKGTNGRWRDVLREAELALYDAAVAKFLSPEQADWLERGSLAAGMRPET
ncbi:MAG: sulfotransferase domain-containing protein [Deltaproteobacteria bacterium]|nr:MAG: sulfotransferase domain-containing protein [Deltaproteobacteria bacterium]